jgi:outer membrane protein OmpA-like peptidoglycan-associated protein
MFTGNPGTRLVTDDILRSGDDMNDRSPALERLGAALDSGDRDAIMACFAPDASVDLVAGDKRMAFAGRGLGEALDTLLAGFDNITLTPSTRQTKGSQVVEESVLSGKHTGSFAGSEPTNGRVHVNLKLSATAAPDSSLKSLRVEADTRALFAQIAETGDIIGVGGGMIAGVRERHNGVRVIDVQPVVAPASAAREASHTSSAKGTRLKWALVAMVPLLLIVIFLAWPRSSTDPSLAVGATQATTSPSSTSGPKTGNPKPKPIASTALPVIATEAPKSTPHVQAGTQVVLRSDVLFALNSAALTPAAKAAVTTLATQIRSAHVTGTIQINGYTDNLGTADKNLALSKARALAVAQVLQAGLAGQAVTLAPQGFGQANPVVPNSTDPNRARNRRVTIVLPRLG